MKTIETPKAPLARGHYSQAISHAGVVYVAGQLPINPDAPETKLEGIEDQARQTLANVRAILEASGSGLDQVLRATVYIAGIEHWPAFNKVYAEVMGSHRPARTVVPVPELHYGYLVEIDAIAAIKDS